MRMLADLVELVIGVDTHQHAHTAAAVTAATGAVLDQATAAATLAGYQQLRAFAEQQPGRRAWPVEGTGGYGAGLTRFLHANAERVVELDRPKRTRPPPRRHLRPDRRHQGRPRGAGPRPARPAPRGRAAGGAVGAAGRAPLGGPGVDRRPTAAARAGRCRP